MTRPHPLPVAAAQPPCTDYDVAANAAAHADVVRHAAARVVVFPELSLTGYHLDAAVVHPDDPALAALVLACRDTGALALAGAPVAGPGGARHIATLAVDAAGVRVAYRKLYLGGREPERFVPGPAPDAVDVDAWRLGLAICRDTNVERHAELTATLGIDAYVAGVVHLPGELARQDARGAALARALGVPVVFAGFAGPTGGGYDDTAGTSTIWGRDGDVLARADAEPGCLARAVLT